MKNLMKTLFATTLLVLAFSASADDWRKDPKFHPVCIKYAEVIGNVIGMRNDGESPRKAKAYIETQYKNVQPVSNALRNEFADIFFLNAPYAYKNDLESLRWKAIGCEMALDAMR